MPIAGLLGSCWLAVLCAVNLHALQVKGLLRCSTYVHNVLNSLQGLYRGAIAFLEAGLLDRGRGLAGLRIVSNACALYMTETSP